MSHILQEWLWFIPCWIFFVFCVYLNYSIDKQKDMATARFVASSKLFLSFAILTFAVTQTNMIDIFKWTLALCVIIVGCIAIKKLNDN